MTDLETRLRAALHEETEPVAAPTGLADRMVTRGARARRRRRVAGGAATLAVVAAAFSAVAGFTGSTTTVGPVSPRPSVHHPAHPTPAPPSVRAPKAWEAGLPDGPPPMVPYVRGMTYRWSPRPGRTASYSIPNVNTNVFGTAEAGVMVGEVSAHPEFGIAGPRGGFRVLGHGTAVGMAASPDGHRVAVASSDAQQIQVYDARSGGQLASTPAKDARVLSWGPGGVYYETGVFSGNEKIWVWSPGSTKPPARTPAALNPDGVGLVTSNTGCTKLATTQGVGDCLPLPRSASGVTVSHDGRYVAYTAAKGRAAWVGTLDTATGTTRRLTPALPTTSIDFQPGNLVWESGDKLVFVLTSHGHRAAASMIRCSAVGGCEVALRDVTGPGNDFFPTLGLTPPLIT